jgi:cupin fold WbuC family metalloprotein
MITLIDNALLDEVCREAAASPRRRKNRNFHRSDDQPGHRLLNAMQPDSYIPPHRHLDPNKDETMVVLRGAMALLVFDETGEVIQCVKVGVTSAGHFRPDGLPAGGTASGIPDALRRAAAGRDAMQSDPPSIHTDFAVGVDIPHGVWHTVIALESDTLFLEAKAGPYLPLTTEEKAPWAPAEGASEAAAYFGRLSRLAIG